MSGIIGIRFPFSSFFPFVDWHLNSQFNILTIINCEYFLITGERLRSFVKIFEGAMAAQGCGTAILHLLSDQPTKKMLVHEFIHLI